MYKILDDSRIQYPNRIIFATILTATQGYKFINDDIEALQNKLTNLRSEHQDLDAAIDNFVSNKPFAQLELQRLKKRKFLLKDQVVMLENQLLPDIIA